MTIVAAAPAATTQRSTAGRREFIALVTSLMAMSALAIDLMLPTFPDMRAEFGMTADSAQVGWIITAYFLGMAVGPWLYGPISDRYGRRRPLFAGLVLYIVGAGAGHRCTIVRLDHRGPLRVGLGAAAPTVARPRARSATATRATAWRG